MLMGLKVEQNAPLETVIFVDHLESCHPVGFFSSKDTIKYNMIRFVLVSLVAQLCPSLCDLMNCSPPGSYVHRIFQARILESVSISSFILGVGLPI